jgi:hypothetical protein
MAIPTYRTATWGSAGTPSDAIDLGAETLCGVVFGATFTGTTMTFTASDTFGGTYVPLYDDLGTQLSVTVSTSRFVRVKPADFAGVRFIKLVSGSSESQGRTAQVASREIE